MRCFLLLAAGVALLDCSSAVQPPQNARGEGRPVAAPAAATPRTVLPAAAIINPSRALHRLLAQVAALEEGSSEDPSPTASASVPSQGSRTPPDSAVAPAETSSSTQTSSLPPVNENPPQANGSRSALEEMLAQAAAVHGGSAESKSPKDSGSRRKRQHRRKALQLPIPPPPPSDPLLPRSPKDDVEISMSLDDIFNQISKVSLFSRSTESKVPTRPRKKKSKKPADKKKRRWVTLKKTDSDSEDDDAPILAVLPRKPTLRMPPQIQTPASDPSVKRNSLPEEPSTPQAALQQLIYDTAGSMGIGTLGPLKGPSTKDASEAPAPPVEEAPVLPAKDSRDTLEDMLRPWVLLRASATIASATRRKKAHRGNIRLGKKNTQLPSKGGRQGSKTTEDEEPILAVLPRRASVPQLPISIQEDVGPVPDNAEDEEPILAVLPRRASVPQLPISIQEDVGPVPDNLLHQAASPQETLQQMLANSLGFSSWEEVGGNTETEKEVKTQEDSSEESTTLVTDSASVATSQDLIIQQPLQGLSSSEGASGAQPTDILVEKSHDHEEALANSETDKPESTLTSGTAAAAAAAWDMGQAIIAARKAAEAAKAARAAATSAKGISAHPGTPIREMPGFEFGRRSGSVKWEDEDSMSDETTESEDSHSGEAGPPAGGGWEPPLRIPDSVEELKSFPHSQWHLSTQVEGTPSSSSEQYEEDSDFGKDSPWEEPSAFAALDKGLQERPAADISMVGSSSRGGNLSAQQAPQDPPTATPELPRMASRPLKAGGQEELNIPPTQRNAATTNQDKQEKRSVPKAGEPHSPKGGSTEKGGDGNISNSFTLSGGWGPAIVFGLMVGVGLKQLVHTVRRREEE
ncbi:hypothetical protein, conserved [Eimeria praecox]|uniref:Uncharacterized protein n=1 Tax=Eimeria praecox TaxID=51316 RepID=U6G2L1_9EIME|nr:hypothetical protein, conserved [Eimeria praecox]